MPKTRARLFGVLADLAEIVHQSFPTQNELASDFISLELMQRP